MVDSTKVWRDLRSGLGKGLENLIPVKYMIMTNTELGTRFTPEVRYFLQEMFASSESPILFRCMDGKDRTGFVSAILLRMLVIPRKTIMEDYILTNQYLVPGFKWKLLFMRFSKLEFKEKKF